MEILYGDNYYKAEIIVERGKVYLWLVENGVKIRIYPEQHKMAA